MYTSAFELEAIPPYSFELTVHKPAGWDWLTPFEIYSEGTVWSAMRLSSSEVVGLRLRSIGTVEKPRIKCAVFFEDKPNEKERKEILHMLNRALSVDEDIREFYAIAGRDPILRETVKDLYGMRRTPFPDLFRGIILAVTLQMAPIRRSEQMMSSLIKVYGEKVAFDGRTVWICPAPDRIAGTSVKELEEKCKLGYRAKNLKSIAEVLCKGFPTLEDLEKMSADEARAKLMELRGIGEYSASLVSPHPGFSLDVWSVKIFHRLFFGERPSSPRAAIEKVRRTAEERWGRWRGYAFTYVLNDLENLSKRFDVKLDE